MDRGSDKHGPAQDEYLKQDLRGLEQADRPTRAEEWRDIDDDGRASGVITDRDLVVRVLGEGRTPATTAVGDVCSTDLATVLEESSVAVADDIMRERAIRRLLVVGTDDRPQGVISIGDLAVTQRPWSAHADIFLAEPPNNPEDG